MSHLSIETLLSLREPGSEPGSATAREHLGQCAQCQAELDRLHQRVARLKALPPLRPARDRWPETAARFRADRIRRRTRLAGMTGLAAAASLALVVGIGRISPAGEQPVVAAADPAQLEVLDGRTARMAEELEDRIARVDRELEATELLRQQAQDQELLRLWRERVGLLDALVDVHVTRASNAGL